MSRPDPLRALKRYRVANRPADRPLSHRPLVPHRGPEFESLRARGLVEPDAQAYALGECSICVGTDPGSGLQHLSIAHPKRLPTWDEVKEARYRLMAPDAVVAMILPPEADYINIHSHCFHLQELPPGLGADFRVGRVL